FQLPAVRHSFGRGQEAAAVGATHGGRGRDRHQDSRLTVVAAAADFYLDLWLFASIARSLRFAAFVFLFALTLVDFFLRSLVLVFVFSLLLLLLLLLTRIFARMSLLSRKSTVVD
ncbi:unnamed protein product, partial [Callosobruchus maculatus]